MHVFMRSDCESFERRKTQWTSRFCTCVLGFSAQRESDSLYKSHRAQGIRMLQIDHGEFPWFKIRARVTHKNDNIHFGKK